MDLAHETEPIVNPGVLVEALSRGLPAERLVVDPDVLAAISHDDAEWAPVGQAAVGVRARSEAEVQHVVRVCAELGAAVVPRGAGTGLSGGANAVGGCVILDVSAMNQILEIDADNLARADPRGPRTPRPGLPGGGGGVEAPGHRGGRDGAATGPHRHSGGVGR
ncbi:MAG TPA: FAD-binding protein, partial [Streptosporangiaceae bacterium]|nr:FAD-binding protein [Streptosporangiaceae bacterium]